MTDISLNNSYSQNQNSNEINQSFEQSSEEKSSNSLLLSKKKRIVRKKYRPRKKDIFVHTICVFSKNNISFQNCLLESIVMNITQESRQARNKKIQFILKKKDDQYLKRLMDSIKFSQTLTSKGSKSTNIIRYQTQEINNIIHKNIQKGEVLKCSNQGNLNPYLQSFMLPLLGLLQNKNICS